VIEVKPPVIDGRNEAQVLADVRARLPGYVPDWQPEPGAAADALHHVFAGFATLVGRALNAALSRAQLSFLDACGESRRPPQAASVPLVWRLTDESPVDVTLPAGATVAAQTGAADGDEPPTFIATESIALARARLAAVYSVNPLEDRWDDHTPRLTEGFTLFEGAKVVEHALYLGHDHLFKLPGPAEAGDQFRAGTPQVDARVILHLGLIETEGVVREDLRMRWEYGSDIGWRPLGGTIADLLITDGQVDLTKEGGPPAAELEILGRKSYWIRGTLTEPLLRSGAPGVLSLPVIDTVRASLDYGRSDLRPEAAAVNGRVVDTTAPFEPFGPTPVRGTTFHLGSSEAFGRPGAYVRIDVELRGGGPKDSSTQLKAADGAIAFEYFDGRTWKGLGVSDDTKVFRKPLESASADDRRPRNGALTFLAPADWKPATVGSVTSHFLRVRLDDDDVFGKGPYIDEIESKPETSSKTESKTDTETEIGTGSGTETETGTEGGTETETEAGTETKSKTRSKTETTSTSTSTSTSKSTSTSTTTSAPQTQTRFHPAAWVSPVATSLRISFAQRTDSTPIDHCVVANAGVLTDATQAARYPRRTFAPFTAIADEQPTVYVGFDRPLPRGLVSLFVEVPIDPDIDTDESSPFVWEYLSPSPRDWVELGVRDQTRGFRASGIIQLIGPFDHVPSDGIGGVLFRIRARLKQGSRTVPRPVGGVWLNAVMATHATRYGGEILGRGTGEPRQLLGFPQGRTPILEGEVIEIREWAGRDRGYEAITETVAKSEHRVVGDAVTGQIVEVWVRWRERPHFFDAGPGDRVYTLERITGLVRFGDGRRGLVPPAGAPIAVSFRTGGGLAGNAPAGSISEPRAAVPFFGGVTNPRSARGGSDAEASEITCVRGAERLRHRDRAVTPRDFEWLAVEASPAVARARCLAATGPAGAGQRGWVTVVIVPYGADKQPKPDDELIGRVRRYLAARAPATLAPRIRVISPKYQPVNVVAEIVPRRPEEAGTIEIEVRRRLDEFLHPLRGGRDGRGWQIGQAVPLSQIAALIEGTPDVDFARDVSLQVDGAVHGDEVPGLPDALPASGNHEIRLTLRGEAC
jgi:hypothetical protein